MTTQSLEDVRRAYRCMYQLKPDAHHIVATFHCYDEAVDAVTVGLSDDGEYRAGRWLLHTLVDTKTDFSAVFVTRSGPCTAKLGNL